jgi:RNA polymerase sigma-70 factor (ECF subfamily)
VTGPVKDPSLTAARADAARVSTLVARAREGDRAAFDRLVELYAPRVYNLALRITGSREEAEDCVQDSFVRAFCAIRKFRGEAAFSTWLYRVALNVSADAAKKRARRALPASELAANDPDDPAPDLDRLSTPEGDREHSPDDSLLADQRRQIILRALRRLPAHHRTVVALCDLQGLSYEESARIMGTRVGTVKSRLSRARLALKDLLAGDLELLRG